MVIYKSHSIPHKLLAVSVFSSRWITPSFPLLTALSTELEFVVYDVSSQTVLSSLRVTDTISTEQSRLVLRFLGFTIVALSTSEGVCACMRVCVCVHAYMCTCTHLSPIIE